MIDSLHPAVERPRVCSTRSPPIHAKYELSAKVMTMSQIYSRGTTMRFTNGHLSLPSLCVTLLALLSGNGSFVIPSPVLAQDIEEAGDPSEIVIGERLFLETRFAQFFKQFVDRGGMTSTLARRRSCDEHNGHGWQTSPRPLCRPVYELSGSPSCGRTARHGERRHAHLYRLCQTEPCSSQGRRCNRGAPKLSSARQRHIAQGRRAPVAFRRRIPPQPPT